MTGGQRRAWVPRGGAAARDVSDPDPDGPHAAPSAPPAPSARSAGLPLPASPLPAWSASATGVVRAPVTGELHLLPAGAVPPRRLAADVDLLCSATGRSTPAVRPYDGPWDERRACCRTCLALARGEMPQPAATVAYLPASAPSLPVGPAPSRLPAAHRAGPIAWQDWEGQPLVSHISSACEACGDPGPGQWTHGSAEQPPTLYIAFRCPACGHERAHLRRDDGTLALVWEQSGRQASNDT
jgi:hypothetical protein